MRRRILAAIVVLAAVAFVATFWQSSPAPQQTATETWSPEATYFFSDRSDPEWIFDYAIRGREVVVQQSLFPGYLDRRWYRQTIKSDDVINRVQEWSVRPGDIFPPFKPGGPWRCRISITPDETKPRGEAWFDNRNSEVHSWFGILKREFVQEERRVDILPEWISDDPNVNKYFGF